MNPSDDFIGENHLSTSAKTPLRADAFSLSDEEKIARIQKSMADIMETLGLDLTDDSLKGTPLRVAKAYVKELFSHDRVLELTAIFGRYGAALYISDTAGVHAEVLGINHTSHILRTEDALHLLYNLHSQALLYLRATRKVIHNAVHLGESQHAAIGDIAHMSTPYDR